jgi:hypothetical protein
MNEQELNLMNSISSKLGVQFAEPPAPVEEVAQPAVEQTAETPAPAPTPVVVEEVKNAPLDKNEAAKLFGFNNEEELKQHLDRKPEITFESDLQKQIYEYAKTAPALSPQEATKEYFRIMSIDTDRINPDQALWEEYKLKNSGLVSDEEDLRAIFDDEYYAKYAYDDDASEQRIKAKQALLKRDAEIAKKTIQEKQSQFAPKEADTSTRQNQQREVEEKWNTTVNEAFSKYANKPLEISYEENPELNFNFEIPKDSWSNAEKWAKDFPTFLRDRYWGQDGNGIEGVRIPDLLQDFAILDSLDKIIEQVQKHSYEQGILSKTREIAAIVPKDTNPSGEPEKQAPRYASVEEAIKGINQQPKN